ncbi:MAG: radical SAM protein [Thermodesulfobacteriota bacterium]
MKLSKLFRSVQGESTFAGYPCAFIRLAGCNLRCRYCDTTSAQQGGEEISIDVILKKVGEYGLKLVEVTGGEPLFQPETPELVAALLKKGLKVLVETNGSFDISVLPKEAVAIVDIKCPSSGEKNSFLWDNVWKLRPHDEIKFVISNRMDYEWARGIVRERFEAGKQTILYSPVFGELSPRRLVEWLLEDGSWARLQLQLHKYIWPPGTVAAQE